MHELAIALDLVDVATDELAKLESARVIGVRLRLGRLSGVVKDALIFSFDAAASGTPLEGARLHIDEVPVTVWCEPCDAERELADLTRRHCPVCQAPAPRIVGGEELQLVGLEIRTS